MGIADYGIGPSGAYEYSSNSSLGGVTIASLSTRNATGGTQVSIQLNVNLHFTANNNQYVYWVQDVAVVDTRTNLVYFLNNVWNSSRIFGATMSGGVSGNGVVRQSGSTSYYVAPAKFSAAGNEVNLKYPSQVYFRMNSSLSASRQPRVSFEYNDGYGWVNYDTVTFTSVTKLTALPGFVVNGFAYNPINFDDAELIIGGPYSGFSTADVQSDVRLQLEYWNGHNYQMIMNAYNFGADTEETISNVNALYYYYQSTGEIISDLFQGSGSTQKLYDQTRVAMVDVKLGLQSGVLYVRNSSAPADAIQAQHPFVSGEVTLVLYPGSYSLQAYNKVGGTLYKAGSATLSGGQSAQPLLGLVGIKIGYLVNGGGSGYVPPSVTYVYGGQKQTAPIGPAPLLLLMDEGTSWSIPTSLAGSSGSERWLASVGGGVASSSQSMNVTYFHQFDVPVSYILVGGGAPPPPVFSYSSTGTAQSLTLGASPQSVWVDGGAGYAATSSLAGSNSRERWSPSPPSGAGSAVVSSASPLIISYHHQYYLAAAPSAGLSSDWFDAGSTATLSAQGVYGRSGDTGQRIVSYSIDGGPPVAVAPALATVSASVLMDSSHTFAFNSVTQYRLTVVGGSGVTLSSSSPTSDGFFDAGSSISASTPYSWPAPQGELQVRLNLLNYSIDGVTTGVPRSGSGAFTTPRFTFDGPKSVAFNAVTQYLVSFAFTSTGIFILRRELGYCQVLPGRFC